MPTTACDTLLDSRKTNLLLEDSLDNQVFGYPSYQTKVSIYPNNEVVIRFQPDVKGGGDNQEDLANYFSAKELENNQRIFYDKCLISTKDDVKIVERSEKSGWGKLPSERYFNKKTSQFIVRSLSAIELKFGKENMRFLTMTLPGSTDSAMRVMSQYSAYIVNRTNTFVKRRLGKYGKYRINVWELQKRGALHCHTVIAGADKRCLEKVDRDYKLFCYRLYQDLSRMTGIDMFERAGGGSWKDDFTVLRCKSEPIRKSVSRYMSKYISKTQSKLSEQADSISGIYYPSVWASWGRGMREALNERSIKFKPKRMLASAADKLVNLCLSLGAKYSPEKYSNPIVYQDKIGGGVNLRAFVNQEFIEDYFEDFKAGFVDIGEVKTAKLDTSLVSMNVVYDVWLNEICADLKNRSDIAKYGSSDERRWRQEFKSNPSPLPVAKDDQSWREYYAG